MMDSWRAATESDAVCRKGFKEWARTLARRLSAGTCPPESSPWWDCLSRPEVHGVVALPHHVGNRVRQGQPILSGCQAAAGQAPSAHLRRQVGES